VEYYYFFTWLQRVLQNLLHQLSLQRFQLLLKSSTITEEEREDIFHQMEQLKKKMNKTKDKMENDMDEIENTIY